MTETKRLEETKIILRQYEEQLKVLEETLKVTKEVTEKETITKKITTISESITTTKEVITKIELIIKTSTTKIETLTSKYGIELKDLNIEFTKLKIEVTDNEKKTKEIINTLPGLGFDFSIDTSTTGGSSSNWETNGIIIGGSLQALQLVQTKKLVPRLLQALPQALLLVLAPAQPVKHQLLLDQAQLLEPQKSPPRLLKLLRELEN